MFCENAFDELCDERFVVQSGSKLCDVPFQHFFNTVHRTAGEIPFE
jgi:hypothetical protein